MQISPSPPLQLYQRLGWSPTELTEDVQRGKCGSQVPGKPLGRENKTAPNKAAGWTWLSITSLFCSPLILCAMAASPLAHHSGALTWAALPPGKSIFGSSWGSRAWPRFRARHPHFLLLTASLLYHKLSRFIFFSTRKGSVTGLSHCPGPLGC